MTVPLTKLESSEAKNRAMFAISSGSPTRGFKLAPAMARSIPNGFGSVIVAPMLVLTPQGAMALQRMPSFAYWNPTFFVFGLYRLKTKSLDLYTCNEKV